MKRLFGIILGLMMVCVCVAAQAINPFLWVGNRTVAGDENGDGWSYDYDSNTLHSI